MGSVKGFYLGFLKDSLMDYGLGYVKDFRLDWLGFLLANA